MSLRAEIVRLGLRWFVKRPSSRQPTIETMRANLARLGVLAPAPPKTTTVEKRTLGGVRAISVATPETIDGRHMLYFHGGGHVAGAPVLYRDFTWRVASATRTCVTILDHRLAPEHPFPAGLDDAVSAYRALLSEGVHPKRIALMGESAGGGLVFSSLLKLRDEGTPLPAAAVALSPWTDLAASGESWHRNADTDPMVHAAGLAPLAGFYLAGADPRTPYASPLYGDLSGFPPSLIQVGSDEVLLDDSVRMAERLRAAGCEAEIEIWPRMPHAWQVWARIMPEAREALSHIGSFVQARMAASAAS